MVVQRYAGAHDQFMRIENVYYGSADKSREVVRDDRMLPCTTTGLVLRIEWLDAEEFDTR